MKLCHLAAGAALAVAAGACAEPEPLLPESLEALRFDTLFTIEATVGSPWETLHGIWDAELDPEDRLALLDLGGPAVHVFDASGAHLGTLAEVGLEPGQLDGPAGIAWDGAGALLVWDPAAAWISRFRGPRLGFVDRFRAFAFGETGFCAREGRVWLSYWRDGLILHEVGSEGPVRSFGEAPRVVGADALGPELREIAVEELTPSALLCTSRGVLDVGFVQSVVRLHDADGETIWSRELDGFRPITVYTPDGVGLGRAFDEGQGSHVLRSVVPWGSSMALIQHELRTREVPAEGDVATIESRLVRLEDGSEVARSRALPPVLAARGQRLVLVESTPATRVTVVQLR